MTSNQIREGSTKAGHSNNFMNDSELLRKAIFELLVGKTYSDYYDSLSKSKALEKEKSSRQDF